MMGEQRLNKKNYYKYEAVNGNDGPNYADPIGN
jgi:hypothetical protein